MRTVCIAFLFILFPALGLSKTIHVPGDYSEIQSAIDASVHGDTVLVDPGTYFEVINYNGKAIVLQSTQGPDKTVIDAQEQNIVVSFHNGEGADSILEGFTVQNGKLGIHCVSSSPVIKGNIIQGNKGNTIIKGGIYLNSSSATVTNNLIQNNEAFFGGGGIKCHFSGGTVENNLIRENSAEMDGGGILCRDSTTAFLNNTIYENSSKGNGGGVYIEGYPSPSTMKNNFIHHNTSAFGAGVFCGQYCTTLVENNTIYGNIGDPSSYGHGGGICCGVGSDPIIQGNRITGNHAIFGGGIFCDQAFPVITSNIIAHNECTSSGGGIFVDDATFTSIVNNLIYHNQSPTGFSGGGIFCNSIVANVINNTIEGNAAKYGGGIHYFGTLMTIRNTILWGNTADTGKEIRTFKCEIDIDYSDLEGGIGSVEISASVYLKWGNNMLDEDPLLADDSAGDLHLTYPSPCRDAGIFISPGVLPHDFEGDPRTDYNAVDMGADEFHTHLYYTGDATPGKKIDLKFVDIPDTAPVVLWFGSGLLDPPLPLTGYGDWYLQFPILFEAHMGAIPNPEGILVSPIAIPLNIPTPLHLPLQALSGTALTNPVILKIE